MDKTLSARLNGATIKEMEDVTRRLGISRKEFLEEAIKLHVERLSRTECRDVWAETLGAWKRQERPGVTAEKIRATFRKSFARYQ